MTGSTEEKEPKLGGVLLDRIPLDTTKPHGFREDVERQYSNSL